MQSTALRPIVKDYATTLRTTGFRTGQPLRRECWGATTTDGEWGFERIDEPGTPWIVVHYPRTERAETATCTFGTLKEARQCVERGLDRWLPSYQLAAHHAGEHSERYSPYGCRACDDARFASLSR